MILNAVVHSVHSTEPAYKRGGIKDALKCTLSAILIGSSIRCMTEFDLLRPV